MRERYGSRHWMFQSTPPRGGRRRWPGSLADRVVSIHAPARGATTEALKLACVDCFNPRPRAGGDPVVAINRGRWNGFNPRPRAGGDNKWKHEPGDTLSFNPRPRAGGDRHLNAQAAIDVSIHAPARGATARSSPPELLMFQSTPPRGGRPITG